MNEKELQLVQAIAKVLTERVVTACSKDAIPITYGELAQQVSALIKPDSVSPHFLGHYLGIVSEKCQEFGAPHVSVIVYSQETGMPGDGFFKQFFPGCTDKESVFVRELNKVLDSPRDIWRDVCAKIEASYKANTGWPYHYLRDRAVEAFIQCAEGLKCRYKPGKHAHEICIMDECDVGFEFCDSILVRAFSTDMIQGTLTAFDMLPYDIDEKVRRCFGDKISEEEHNRRCAQYIDWAFSSKDNPPAYGWNMEDYLPIHNGSCWIYKSDKHY